MFSRIIHKARRLVSPGGERPAPTIIPQSVHKLAHKAISQNARKVLYRLQKNGYSAYLVGGGVRDLLLGGTPKDFDVATNAHPDAVRKLFGNCRIIGKRFRLAHIFFSKEIIEVATFRAEAKLLNKRREGRTGLRVRDNVYGTLGEDAWRRDFTINALYYNMQDSSIVDHCGGMEDLNLRQIRMIGDPQQRYHEDPVRMLRAIRFATKLDFQIEPQTREPLENLGDLLDEVPSARLFEEVLKLFHYGKASANYEVLLSYGLFSHLFPLTRLGNDLTTCPTHALLSRIFKNTDERINRGKTVTPAFLFAALLWESVLEKMEKERQKGVYLYPALEHASTQILTEQSKRIAIPNRLKLAIRDIWRLQLRLNSREGTRAFRLLGQPRFRAGYDFLLMRADIDPTLANLAQWWTDFQKVPEEEQQKMVAALRKPSTASQKKRRKKRRKKPEEPSSS